MSISSNVPVGASEPHSDYGYRIATLEHRVNLLEAGQPRPRNRDWPPSPDLVERIKEITRELFPGDVETEISFDPSEPDDPWLNFCVTSSLEYAPIRPLRQVWHERVERLGVADTTRFRLLISPL